jgi:hypothetical protein
MDDNRFLEMKFDPNTISHLGLQMYATLPPVIAEMISNSYDADASKVTLVLNDLDISNKIISVEDDGHGMSFDEINTNFLLIGRNRREGDPEKQKSRSGERYVIGKKGIGKLAFFGVAQTIQIATISNGLQNIFVLDWNDLIHSEGVYKPRIIKKDEKTTAADGTKITLTNLTRKSNFNPKDIAVRLAKAFSIFDEKKFNVIVKHNNDAGFPIDNKLRFEGIDADETWNFPLLDPDIKYDYSNKELIAGQIIASKTTIPEKMRGIALFSRGKLVNEHSFFDVKATSFGYSYLTGWLDIDFIDEWIPDVISTNRQSLNWEDERCNELKKYLEAVISFIYAQHRNSMEISKKKRIQEKTGLDIDAWIEGLPKHDKNLANKLVKAIVSNEGIDGDKAAELTGFVKDSFQFAAFKELAAEIDGSKSSDAELLNLLNEWKVIEAREMYKLSEVRIRTIQRFQEYIKTDAKEVPVMHNFFKQFPWLLDPRLMDFEDEVTYSQILRDQYPDSDEKLEEDRRIDFLCHNFVENMFIIELKRPSKVLGEKELLQALNYNTFMQKHLGNESHCNITCYIIGKQLSSKPSVQALAKSLKESNSVVVRTYTELLNSAIGYHKEFIDKYESLQATNT